MTEKLTPTNEEVGMWLLDTVRHVLHIEYFLNHLALGSNDNERPHDLVGSGNKFECDPTKINQRTKESLNGV